MTIASDYITAAYGLSTKNNPTKTATPTELLRILNTSFHACYAIAARINYLAFAVREVIPKITLGWPYPACAELVFRIELATGEEVALVPYNQRFAEPGRPGVYYLGGFYNAAGNPTDPGDEPLVLLYSKMPVSFTTVDDEGDTTWHTRHDRLVIADLAMYLARKDGRTDELPDLSAERDAALQLFVAFLEHANVMETRMYGAHRFMPTYTIQSLAALLAGGPPTSSAGPSQ